MIRGDNCQLCQERALPRGLEYDANAANESAPLHRGWKRILVGLRVGFCDFKSRPLSRRLRLWGQVSSAGRRAWHTEHVLGNPVAQPLHGQETGGGTTRVGEAAASRPGVGAAGTGPVTQFGLCRGLWYPGKRC